MAKGASKISGGGGGGVAGGKVAVDPKNLTDEEASALQNKYEAGFTDAQKKSVDKYISNTNFDGQQHSLSQTMNFLISRGEDLNTATAAELNAKYGLNLTQNKLVQMQKTNQNIDAAMHPLGADAILERGAHSGVMKLQFGINDFSKLSESQLKQKLVGQAFANTAVWSTSYNTTKNPFLSSSSGVSGGREIIYRIKAGKNTQCVFGAKNQAEIILGKGTNFRITDVAYTGKTAYPKSGGAIKQVLIDIETF